MTERWFTTRTIRWIDANGVKQVADQYTDVDLTPKAVKNGLAARALIPISDPRRRDLHNVHGGRHPNVKLALDLDDEVACQPKADNTEAIMAAANIVQIDRGPDRKIAYSEQRF